MTKLEINDHCLHLRVLMDWNSWQGHHVLSASLYRRLRGLATRHWLETAFRRTALPFALTAAIVSASGWGMALYAPEAHSIGDVISRSSQGS